MPDDITPDAVLNLILEQQIIETPAPVEPDTDLFALGLDSMAMMQLLLHIEDRFGISVGAGEMTRDRFATAVALAAFLSAKRASA